METRIYNCNLRPITNESLKQKIRLLEVYVDLIYLAQGTYPNSYESSCRYLKKVGQPKLESCQINLFVVLSVGRILEQMSQAKLEKCCKKWEGKCQVEFLITLEIVKIN